MSKEWVTGCSHLGHEAILRLCKRPFSSIHEMNKAITDNWNSIVEADDTVYVLGDMTYRAAHPGWQYAEKLNGNIILIWGNHDRDREGYERHGIKVDHTLEFERDGTPIVLHHNPIEEWNGWSRGSVRLHAHCHGNRPNQVRRYDCGVDTNNFTPLDLEYVAS